MTYHTDPPPNNAGIFSSIPLYPRAAGQPRRKILLFSQLQVTFDYETKMLTVTRASDLNNEFSFDEKDLLELRAALQSFGLEIPPGDGVTCR